jgi:hypothetical protein
VIILRSYENDFSAMKLLTSEMTCIILVTGHNYINSVAQLMVRMKNIYCLHRCFNIFKYVVNR